MASTDPNTATFIQSSSLRLDFSKPKDRFESAVSLAELGTVLKSQEGSPEDEFPASPPFQECSIESRSANEQVALLVGMAGKNHWSAAISTDSRPNRLVFDVACRVTEGVSETSRQQLGSQYILLESPKQKAGTELSQNGSYGSELTFIVGERQFSFQSELNCQFRFGDEGLIEVAPVDLGAKTIRWKYSVSAV